MLANGKKKSWDSATGSIRQRIRAVGTFEISHEIDELVMAPKGIRPNVHFYSASVQETLDILRDYSACICAVARAAGWVAHDKEQFRDNNRLIRPTSNYIGGFGGQYREKYERKK